MIDFRLPTALFGGSFDPVHEGHLAIARRVLALPGVRQLVFVPCAQSPGKAKPVAPAAQRLAWLELVAGEPGFHVWDFDVRRGGESFTVETLREAHARGARLETLYWVLGADAYAGFDHWKEPGEIRRLARLLVVNRPGHEARLSHPDDVAVSLPPHPASSTALRAALAAGEPTPYLPAPVRRALENALPGENPYARKK